MRVTTHHLGKAYGLRWALRDLNLQVSSGELVALLGPNGAGKTTLLKMLAGLLRPTTGRIDVHAGEGSAGRADRPAVGLLIPGQHLYDHLTVTENLEFFTGLYRRRPRPEKLDRALETVGLRERSRELVAALSSGMRCRLAIAKWQLLDPALLLLDEPYGVLDAGGTALLESHLRTHCERGGAVIIASHHIARMAQLCSRALILADGRLIFDETRTEPWESLARAFGEFLPPS